MPELPTADAAALAALADEAWLTLLAADPIAATALGDRRFDDRLPPVREADIEATVQAERDLLSRARELAGADGWAPADRTTASALVETLELAIALLGSRVSTWSIDPLDGPQVAFLDVPSFQPVATVEQGRMLIARWQAMGPWIEAHAATVREGLADGHVSPISPIRRVVGQLDALLAQDDASWALLEPLADPHADWPDRERAAFDRDLRAAVRDVIRPAFAAYRELLTGAVLPRARADDRPGLEAVPGGRGAYAALVRGHTSLELSPEAIHELGLAEVARIDAELEELAAAVLGTRARSEATARLRSDPTLHFGAATEIVAVARDSLARAEAAVPGWFGIRPQAPCEVVEIPAHEAEHTTIAYYREPAMDGAFPGRYFVNTFAPESRPRYEAEALAFHESVPGHHLQIAIAQERTDLPAFRRFSGSTAYIEGWGLYSERLAEEMGLYSGDLDRLGVRSFDGWRACRLVVDTGMHALGWSRQRAIDFMVEHTALAPNNIANEVDRYISGPGQALAYKLGQLELLRLRTEAREALGPAFDVRGFHDVVLREGALGLGTLGSVVRAWIHG